MTRQEADYYLREQPHDPGSRVIRIPNAGHYLFITHEADVLREVTAFISTLSAR